MRNFIAAFSKALLLIALASFTGAGLAWAGEGGLTLNSPLLGRILASDGGTANNANTGYLTAGCSTTEGSCDQAFPIPANQKITIQCDEAAIVAANRRWTDAGTGIALTAGQIFPTSTAAQSVTYFGIGGRTDDAGTYTGGMVSIAPAVGASSARCRVYLRSGTE